MFLDFLFGKKQPPNVVPAAPPKRQESASEKPVLAPGTHIGYHAELVSQLEGDHQNLLRIMGMVGEALAAHDLTAVVLRLDEFRSAIQDHLLTENVRLYVYLEHALVQDPVSHALIHEFRREMDGIGKAVLNFLAKYRALETQPDLVHTFGDDLNAVGKVLAERIRREEAMLYPLYMPAY